MEEVRSDPEMQSQYIPRNPVSRVIQCAAVSSENEVGGCRPSVAADYVLCYAGEHHQG